MTVNATVDIAPRKLRAMWLLNHSSARRFEIPMLKQVGIDEIFLPKRYPNDPGFRSASVDWSEDAHLSIPAEDLALLNAADWYAGASLQAWEVANRHFDVLFFIVADTRLLPQIAKRFNGLAIWRTYGLQRPASYDGVLAQLGGNGELRRAIDLLGNRLVFGEAYAHLADNEPDYLRKRRLHLPLGLAHRAAEQPWEGADRRILFVCPDLAFNSYYAEIYKRFEADFGDLPHAVAGAQPIRTELPHVLGFVSAQEHARNMTQSRVMYYHSDEPNHIHYHPFEAVSAGMPLVFMAGGMLDRMGGENLPGRCRTVAEARAKLERILDNDRALIDSIRASQPVLLKAMDPQHCEPAWHSGFAQLRKQLATLRTEQATRPAPTRRKRIAVCLPIVYGGGTLRGAQLLAQALHLGSRQSGEDADILLLHPDSPEYADSAFADCPAYIRRRPFNWRVLSAAEARRAMRYAGHTDWSPLAERYAVIDDGIQQLQDCDLWLLVSDRVSIPVLPLKPIVVMVYDYLQRYENILPNGADSAFLNLARHAGRVLVTTEFSRQDALQYAGIEASRVCKVPMLAPSFEPQESPPQRNGRDYFLWTTNAALHKNHERATQALQIYYEELDGQLACWISGQATELLLGDAHPHLQAMAQLFQRSKALRKRVKWKGRMSEDGYRQALAGARFLWHPTRIDNGTFSVVEAAQLGVPALSSDYPAMHEVSAQFDLSLHWMDADDPRDMAEGLKYMEQHAHAQPLPDADSLAGQRVEALAGAYWQGVRECL